MDNKATKDSLTGLAWIFYAISLGCIIFGLVTAYYYPASSDDSTFDIPFNHVVGSDAYNFIIMGLRALVWIVLGLISTVIGSTFMIIRGLISKTVSIETQAKELTQQEDKKTEQ